MWAVIAGLSIAAAIFVALHVIFDRWLQRWVSRDDCNHIALAQAKKRVVSLTRRLEKQRRKNVIRGWQRQQQRLAHIRLANELRLLSPATAVYTRHDDHAVILIPEHLTEEYEAIAIAIDAVHVITPGCDLNDIDVRAYHGRPPSEMLPGYRRL